MAFDADGTILAVDIDFLQDVGSDPTPYPVLTTAAIGMFFGSLVGGNAAPALLNVLYLPMAFLSGLWLPLSMLPGALATAAPAWPAYHLGQLGLKVVGHDAGGPVWLHLLVLAVVAIAFFVLAQRRLSRAE